MSRIQKTNSKTANTYERIVDTATILFSSNGYYATGINLIIAQSGITKSTFYRHFPSKDDLVIAVLKKIHLEFIEEMQDHVTQNTSKNENQVLLTFDYLKLWFEKNSFFGCPFVSAANEYSNKNTMILDECKFHKKNTLDYIEYLTRQSGFSNPRELARAIYLLQEGATTDAFVNKRPEAALKAKNIAVFLLKNW